SSRGLSECQHLPEPRPEDLDPQLLVPSNRGKLRQVGPGRVEVRVRERRQGLLLCQGSLAYGHNLAGESLAEDRWARVVLGAAATCRTARNEQKDGQCPAAHQSPASRQCPRVDSGLAHTAMLAPGGPSSKGSAVPPRPGLPAPVRRAESV